MFTPQWDPQGRVWHNNQHTVGTQSVLSNEDNMNRGANLCVLCCREFFVYNSSIKDDSGLWFITELWKSLLFPIVWHQAEPTPEASRTLLKSLKELPLGDDFWIPGCDLPTKLAWWVLMTLACYSEWCLKRKQLVRQKMQSARSLKPYCR